jgi:hypothetical protein
LKKTAGKILLTFCFASLFLLLSAPLDAKNYVKKTGMGRIDWSNGIIEADGIGYPPSDPLNPAQARSAAQGKAVLEARSSLLDIVERIRVDSDFLIKDRVDENALILNEIKGFLRRSEVVAISFRGDGSIRATVALNIIGPFLEWVLPDSIQDIHPIRQPTVPNNPEESGFTGLVVDGRGLPVHPAMVLRLLDEEGNEVYGTAFMSRAHAIERGTASYLKDLEDVLSSDRVGRNPLTVRGIRTAPSGACDIMISNADAARVAQTAGNLDFLQECRVLVVID